MDRSESVINTSVEVPWKVLGNSPSGATSLVKHRKWFLQQLGRRAESKHTFPAFGSSGMLPGSFKNTSETSLHWFCLWLTRKSSLGCIFSQMTGVKMKTIIFFITEIYSELSFQTSNKEHWAVNKPNPATHCGFLWRWNYLVRAWMADATPGWWKCLP